jgi:hypothetical protein
MKEKNKNRISPENVNEKEEQKISRRDAIKRAAALLLVGGTASTLMGMASCPNYYSVLSGQYRSCCYYSHISATYTSTSLAYGSGAIGQPLYWSGGGRTGYFYTSLYYCSCPH